jgi:serine/threonine protein kinase
VSYCINPLCPFRENQDSSPMCESCGNPLTINNRFRLIRPLRNLSIADDVALFDAIDLKGSYNRPPNQLKVIKVLMSNSTLRRTLFRSGAEIAMSLVHPRIPYVDIEDYFEITIEGQWSTLLCLAMEKIEGDTLTKWVKRHGKITQRKAITWMQQLAEIIDYIHQEKVLHRDIKPDNILIRPDGTLYLIDFDGARRMSSTYFAKLRNARNPITGIISGLYTSPEQFERKPVPQSDFYSLGMTILFALTGSEPSSIPKQESTGRLMWLGLTKGLDPPFVKFINNLIHPSVARRPSHSIELINIVFVDLPRRLRRYEIYHSLPFRCACVVMALLATVGLIHVGRIRLSKYYYDIGKQQANNADYQSARKSLNLSIWLRKTEPAYRAMALLCVYLVDTNCARDNYVAATKVNPTDDSPYFNLATYYEDRKQYDEAIKTYEKALDYKKNDPDISNNIARLYIRKGEYQEALKKLKSALKTIDNLPTKEASRTQSVIYKNIGWVLFLQKEFNSAESYLNKSININKNIVAPYCLLAQVKEALKKPAREDWNKCYFPNENKITDPEDILLPEIYEWKHQRLNQALQDK